MKYLKRFNEELKPETYISAADKLSKFGHKKRPEELRNWATEVKKRETDIKRKNHLEEAKKLGVFEMYVKSGINNFSGNFYIDLMWNNDKYELEKRISGFREDGGALWLDFDFGLIPADEETNNMMFENLDKYLQPHDSYPLTWWVNKLWINISVQSGWQETEKLIKFYQDNSLGENITEEELIPSGSFYLSDDINESTELKFKGRKNAIKFIKVFKDILDSNIIYKESPSNPGGMKEKILEYLVDEGFDFEEYLRIPKSLSLTRLNKLYID